jgi:hypothetical protein
MARNQPLEGLYWFCGRITDFSKTMRGRTYADPVCEVRFVKCGSVEGALDVDRLRQPNLRLTADLTGRTKPDPV